MDLININDVFSFATQNWGTGIASLFMAGCTVIGLIYAVPKIIGYSVGGAARVGFGMVNNTFKSLGSGLGMSKAQKFPETRVEYERYIPRKGERFLVTNRQQGTTMLPNKEIRINGVSGRLRPGRESMVRFSYRTSNSSNWLNAESPLDVFREEMMNPHFQHLV